MERMSATRSLGVLSLGLLMSVSVQAAHLWDFAAVPQHKMNLAAAPVSSGVAGVAEIISYTCIDGMPCTWSFSLALDCKAGETVLAVVTAPALEMKGQKGPPGSFLRCGGQNPGLPGTFVYLIERNDIFSQLALQNSPVTFRVSLAEGKRMRDVRTDFSGSAAVLAGVNSGHQGR